MYNEFDKILSAPGLADYWYDEEFMYAQQLLNDFTDKDWEALFKNIIHKEDEWKIKLVYCIDDDSGINGLHLLLSLLNEKDEIVEYVIDSLRSFDQNQYRERIRDTSVIRKAKSLLQDASPPVKQVLMRFIKDIE